MTTEQRTALVLGTATELTNELLIVAVTAVLSFLAGRFLQSRQFKHQQRFEREYPLNLKLLEELINLRTALGNLASDIAPFVPASHETAAHCFNEFKNTVRNNEPVLHPTVFNPAREIESRAREIISNIDKSRSIDEGQPLSPRGRSIEADEQHAAEQLRLDDENERSLEEIERLFDQVKQAIGKRIAP